MIKEELASKKLAIKAIDDMFKNFKMGQNSSDEFLDLDDSDSDEPICKEEEIKK